MTEQRLEPGAAASLALNTLSAQVTAIINAASGAAKVQAESLMTLLNSNIGMIIEAANDQVDEINELIDQLEQRDSSLLKQSGLVIDLRKKIEELISSQEESEALHQAALQEEQSARLDAEGKTARTETKLVAANAESQRLNRELKELKSLDPVGTKKRLNAKQKELDAVKAAQVELRSQNLKLKTKSVSDDKKIAELCKTIEAAQGNIDMLQGDTGIRSLAEKHLKKNFHGTDTGDYWYCYVIPGGLSAYADYILETDWTMFIVNQNGLGCTVMLTEWLEPVIPKADFTLMIPSPLVEAIKAFTAEAMGDKFYHLFVRKDHFSGISVRELPGIQSKYLDCLEAANIKTVSDVMLTRTERLAMVKGLGQKTAHNVFTAAKHMVELWEKERTDIQEAA